MREGEVWGPTSLLVVFIDSIVERAGTAVQVESFYVCLVGFVMLLPRFSGFRLGYFTYHSSLISQFGYDCHFFLFDHPKEENCAPKRVKEFQITVRPPSIHCSLCQPNRCMCSWGALSNFSVWFWIFFFSFPAIPKRSNCDRSRGVWLLPEMREHLYLFLH